MTPDTRKGARLIIVDQGLRQLGGHHAEYSLSVASAAVQLLPVVILAHARCAVSEPCGVEILPIFRFEWTQAQRARTTLDYDPATGFTSWLFLNDLRRGLARAAASRGDHVFIHSIGFDEIEDILAFAMAGERRTLPTFHILLRRDLDEIGDEAERRHRFIAYVRAFARLGLWPDLVRFYADTDELSEHYAAATGVPFVTLPIPFAEHAAQAALHAIRDDRRDGPVIVGYLGDARIEKGYQLLPLAAAALADYLSAGKVRLRLQSSFPIGDGEAGIADSRRQLESFDTNAIELICEAMSQAEYYRQLEEIDIVLLPYLPNRYRRRSSGIFAQAMASGKIVIVPQGTTMSAEAERCGIESCIRYDTASDLPNAIADAINRVAGLRERARIAGEQWLARQPTMTLVKTLLRQPLVAAESMARFAGPVVLQVLDGPNAFGQREAAQRAALRVGVFQRLGCRVLTILAVPACPSSAELTAWLSRNYQHWFAADAAFSWLLYLTQPVPDLPASVATETRNSELFSLPETLPATIRGIGIDAVWVQSLTTLLLLDLLELEEDVPVVFECHELRSLRYALQRRGSVMADDLIAELALLGGKNVVPSPETILSLYLPADSRRDHCLAAFPAPPSDERTTGKVAKADLLLVIEDNDAAAQCQWFCDHLYVPHLLARGVTVALAGSAAAGPCRPDIARRFANISWLDAPVALPEQAFEVARIVVLPIMGCTDLGDKKGEVLAAHASDLPATIMLATNPTRFAAQLLHLLAEASRPVPREPAGGQHLPGEAGGYINRVTRQLQTILEQRPG